MCARVNFCSTSAKMIWEMKSKVNFQWIPVIIRVEATTTKTKTSNLCLLVATWLTDESSALNVFCTGTQLFTWLSHLHLTTCFWLCESKLRFQTWATDIVTRVTSYVESIAIIIPCVWPRCRNYKITVPQ